MRKISPEHYQTITADLNRAERFLQLLAEEKQSSGPASLREALSLAAVVSYCRPFTTGSPGGGNWIPKELVSGLEPDLRELHCELKTLRDKLWAHSVGASRRVKLRSDSSVWSSIARVVIPNFRTLIREVKSLLRPEEGP